jgi:hypothetical protein
MPAFCARNATFGGNFRPLPRNFYGMPVGNMSTGAGKAIKNIVPVCFAG